MNFKLNVFNFIITIDYVHSSYFINNRLFIYINHTRFNLIISTRNEFKILITSGMSLMQMWKSKWPKSAPKN